MGTMAYQITSFTIVYSSVYSGADQRKHQSFASLAFVPGIHRWPVRLDLPKGGSIYREQVVNPRPQTPQWQPVIKPETPLQCYYETAHSLMQTDLIGDKSTLFQVMAWCCQTPRHYLSQCCPRSMSSYGVTWPRCVNYSEEGFSRNHSPHEYSGQCDLTSAPQELQGFKTPQPIFVYALADKFTLYQSKSFDIKHPQPSGVHIRFQSICSTWASYQIRKIAGCACAGNAGNVSPSTDFKRNR